jgi:hypothetical protein
MKVDIWEALGSDNTETRNGGPPVDTENSSEARPLPKPEGRPLPFNQRFHIEDEERLLQVQFIFISTKYRSTLFDIDAFLMSVSLFV